MTVFPSAAVTLTIKMVLPFTSFMLPPPTALAPVLVGVTSTLTEVVPKGTWMVAALRTETPFMLNMESEVSVEGSTMTVTM